MAGEIFMRVNEVAEELGVSVPYAYKLIRELNEELAVDPACNGDAAGLSQLFVQLADELIRIRN